MNLLCEIALQKTFLQSERPAVLEKEVLKGDMELPNWGIKLIRRLEEKGFEAYAVGGCVRDMLLGKKPEDYDFAVSALPDETKQALNGVPILIPDCGTVP